MMSTIWGSHAVFESVHMCVCVCVGGGGGGEIVILKALNTKVLLKSE